MTSALGDRSPRAAASRWATFRESYGEIHPMRCFANHCPRCGAMQEDLYVHSEPDESFFGIPRAAHGAAVRLTPLVGRVRLSGDESFEV